MSNQWRVVDADGIPQLVLADDAAKAKWESENPTKLKLWHWRVEPND